MEEEGTKTCRNCKREIPARNYDIHSVHCARNIKMCGVCKEPVPASELDEHHKKLHKLLPCKECGEKVCGTDLEDHIRDSCAHTMKSCRFCELDLPRGELPGHERYCGARTEQCSDCGEWVMQRYRQLHLDSNHGFLKLDEDPEPIKKTNMVNPISNKVKNKDNANANFKRDPGPANAANQRKPINLNTWTPIQPRSSPRESQTIDNDLTSPGSSNGAIPRSIKRVNNSTTQPRQVNVAGDAPNKVSKNLWSSRTMKKRPAPPPPRPPPGPRALPAERALQRREHEERERAEQSAANLAQGLPPVLSAAEKLDKLRKMDALQNREVEDRSYKNVLQGRVWMSPDVCAGHVPGQAPVAGQAPARVQAPACNQAAGGRSEAERQRDSLRGFVPMTPEEFGERFRTLQLGGRAGDRFSEIKSSLRELRRGLNEVTAPYNQSSAAEVNSNHVRERGAGAAGAAAGAAGAAAGAAHESADEDADEAVALPCEFCDQLVPLHDLVVHQTGCRPDLAQLLARPAARHDGDVADDVRDANDEPAPEPVIPCEFCAQSLPIELITEHQVRCERESRLLFPD